MGSAAHFGAFFSVFGGMFFDAFGRVHTQQHLCGDCVSVHCVMEAVEEEEEVASVYRCTVRWRRWRR